MLNPTESIPRKKRIHSDVDVAGDQRMSVLAAVGAQTDAIEELSSSATSSPGGRTTRNRSTAANRGNSNSSNHDKSRRITSQSGKNKESSPGLSILQGMIDDAKYEIANDCNRGVGLLHARDTNSTQGLEVSYWDACRVGVLSLDNLSREAVDSNFIDGYEVYKQEETGDFQPLNLSDGRSLVLHGTGCACPSLQEWTKERIEKEEERKKKAEEKAKRLKKRGRSNHPIDLTGADASSDSKGDDKPVILQGSLTTSETKVMLGRRPTDSSYRCQCDNNPFCLVSCGGVVDDILNDRLKEIIASSEPEDDSEEDVKTTPASNNQDQCKEQRPQQNQQQNEDEMKEPASKRHKTENGIANHSQVDTMNTNSNDGESVGVLNGENVEMAKDDVDDKNVEKAKDESEKAKDDVEKANDHGIDLPNVDVDEEQTKAAVTQVETPEANSDKVTRADPQEGNVNDTTNVTAKRLFDPHRYDEELVKTGPAKLFAEYGNDPSVMEKIVYTDETTRGLKLVRSTTDVDQNQIVSHLRKILRQTDNETSAPQQECDDSSGKQGESEEKKETDNDLVHQYVKKIIALNKALVFVNTAEDRNPLKDGMVRLARPPGIENLGATCYLNTQLQCLAQNPVFMDGIFSWRAVNDSHGMNKVMSELQKLLARMLLGKERKLTTVEFSSALGLEHDEQQDPNEFARLLFDRMGESFQQCDDGTDEGKKLAGLLERIFHGNTTYETKCLACNTVSTRQEGFMDITLPILKPSDLDQESDAVSSDGEEREQKRQKKESSKSIYGKGVDTDVQFCLNQYAAIEGLKGDNQYFCSNCKCKQDAERALKLTKLPPVLNVQLSRYVFDREKFVKKKVMDKVLLPTVLSIEQHEDDLSSSSTKTYLLCAVMRHHGTSAYAGHYVAEAMDWTTGQWYEFNDETVRPLPLGPSCSLHPDNFDVNDVNNVYKEISGSQHAYNMYYVDQDYLGSTAIKAVDKRIEIERLGKIDGSDSSEGIAGNGILVDMIVERDEYYRELDCQCASDRVVAERLGCRRVGIRKFMLPSLESLVFPHVPPSDELVWVDGNTLRMFLSCNTDLDERLKSDSPIIARTDFFCPHDSFHPRDIRRGKLLRRSQYDAYVSLLEAERKYLSSIDPDVSFSRIVDSEFRTSADQSLTCDKCSLEYRTELDKKVDLVESILMLYIEVPKIQGPTERNLHFQIRPELENERYAYAVTRANITKFRHFTDSLFRSVEMFDRGGVDDKENPFPVGGLDDLDLSKFPAASSLHGGQNGVKDESLDDFFLMNKRITCPHGDNTQEINSRNVTRSVPYEVWLLIKKIFPDAIERRICRVPVTVYGSKKRSLMDQVCQICSADKEATEMLKSKLEEWSKDTKEKASKTNLLHSCRTNIQTISKSNLEVVQAGCRLVHADDIKNFQRIVKTLNKRTKMDAGSLNEVKTFVERKAFPSQHAVLLGFEEEEAYQKFFESIRQLLCRTHNQIVKRTIVENTDADDSGRWSLSDAITVLSPDEHQVYICSLAGLLHLLDNADRLTADDSVEPPRGIVNDIFNQLDRFHPVVGAQLQVGEGDDESVLSFSDGGGDHKEFMITSSLCDCEDCRRELLPSLKRAEEEKGSKLEHVSIDGDDDSAPKTKAATVDLVDSDTDNEKSGSFKFKVYEVDKLAPIEKAMKHVREAMGLPSQISSHMKTIQNWLVPVRRSNRKRNINFPVGGCINDEKQFTASLHHNIAALKLRMHESCEVPLSACKLFVVLLLEEFHEPIPVEIEYGWSEKSLKEIVDLLEDRLPVRRDLPSKLDDCVAFLYQEENSENTEDINMMDYLLQVANFDESDAVGGRKKKKKERRPERGFSGTLLQSSSTSKGESGKEMEQSPPDSAKEANAVDCETESSCALKKDKGSLPRMRNIVPTSHSKTIEVSDDEIDDMSDTPEVIQNDDCRKGQMVADEGSITKQEIAKQFKENMDDVVNPGFMNEAIDYAFSNRNDGDVFSIALAKYYELVDNGGGKPRPLNSIQQREPPIDLASLSDTGVNDSADDNDDGGDEEFLYSGPTFTSPKGHSACTSSSTRQTNRFMIELRDLLAEELQKNNIEAEESEIWDTVQVAINSNTDVKRVENLVDTAFVLFQSKRS